MRTTHLLYLHGFRSSPQSAKARKMAEVMRTRFPAVHWWCPQLPPSPGEAMQQIMAGVAGWQASGALTDGLAVIGSSLGGFYATAVAERTGCKAVLLNPAVEPARDLARYIGEQTSWHDPGERFFFEPRYVDELKALHAGPLRAPQNYLAVIAKGDEVLDWREMTARYAGAKLRLLEGGDHALSDFDDHLPAILAFLGLD
ncbi:YqiA/YcfP family alpha/beta fold hydrolase [Polaromonas sp. YR568]|uniref:YqiA/YcfP family alpha/beta fold hydrolase n=1 Tax=Polaromonas sp. YR568 TaxID=1855301 RepID=UPI0031382402